MFSVSIVKIDFAIEQPTTFVANLKYGMCIFRISISTSSPAAATTEAVASH